MATETVLVVEDLSVTLNTPNGPLNAVHDVSFLLRRGESMGIVGESGSGKSMTALALMNLLPRSATRQAKQLRLLAHDLSTMDDSQFAAQLAGQKIGMIFQEPMTSLNPVYSIGRQLTEGVVQSGLMTKTQATQAALELMYRVGLPDPKARFSQYPHQFSGGQRQRVMIAMALMTMPDLIIADEPTTALDVTVQAQILDLISDIQREMGMAMILITHDLGVIAQTVDKVAVMYCGEFIESGSVGAVLGNPGHPYTTALLHAAPEIGRAKTRLMAIPGQIQPVYGARNSCVFSNRCSQTETICKKARPPIVENEQGHTYRCVLGPDRVRSEPMGGSEVAKVTADDTVIEMANVFRVFQTKANMFAKPRLLRAVDGVSFDVKQGETFALVGESGSGKSTLARMLLGLDTPTAGSVRVAGVPVAELSGQMRAALIQPIFQDPYSSLNPRRRIGDIIAQPLAIHRIGNAQDQLARTLELMELVGLPERFRHNFPNQLSGGQRQRVAIARALIMKPKILICDEPTSALDVSVQAQILNLLDDLRAEIGLTLFLITHDIGVVHQVADIVAVMRSGKLVEIGPADIVLHNPSDTYTQALLSAVPSSARALKTRHQAVGANQIV